MTSVRQLRADAAKSLRRAKTSCTLATRESRIVAKTRCEMLKANELRLAKKHCDAAYRSAELARKAYQRARKPETPARTKSRETQKEKRERARRDAVARVVQEHQVPEGVAEAAVRIVERRGAGRGPATSRWERLAEGVTGRTLAAAWNRYEKQTAKARPRPELDTNDLLEHIALAKKKKKKKKQRAPTGAEVERWQKRAQQQHDVEVLLSEEFGEDFEVF